MSDSIYRCDSNGVKWKINVIEDGLAIALSDDDFHNDCVIVPERIGNQPVIALQDKAFYKRNDIIEVKLPDSLRRLGEEAFFECRSLKKVNIPDQLMTISKWCFAYCTDLQEIDGIDHIIYFKSYCFYRALCLQEIYLGDIEFIDYYAFSESFLQRLSIGNINTAGKFCFSRCSLLSEVVFRNNAKAVPAYFLYGCVNLQKVVMGDVVAIGEYAFGKCKKLRNMKIPASITKIGINILFENQMDTVIIPERFENECLGAESAHVISYPIVSIILDYCEKKLGKKTILKYYGEKLNPIQLEETNCRYIEGWYERKILEDSIRPFANSSLDNCNNLVISINSEKLLPFDFEKPICTNITLFAKWEIKENVREAFCKTEELCN